MIASFKKYRLEFKRPSGTSRGILTTKDSWFLILEEEGNNGLGECSLIEGLSPDNANQIESILLQLCDALEANVELPDLTHWPAVQMGLETAMLSLRSKNPFSLFPSAFTKGEKQIPINGLVWMGDYEFMRAQIDQLLTTGFDCIKLKIGALDFDSELDLLARIRGSYSESDINLRVDANGAFKPDDALEKLKRLSDYQIHSIEQPIAVNQWETMAKLCQETPLPIALDEELIGHYETSEKHEVLRQINPHYVILKPSLLGGFAHSEQWIDLAEKLGIGWWVTSALESNIGLNAIAQWAYQLKVTIPQGLGTGSLFVNNIDCPLFIEKGCLCIDNSIPWDSI
jgi:o-succinylbenzoate synthase